MTALGADMLDMDERCSTHHGLEAAQEAETEDVQTTYLDTGVSFERYRDAFKAALVKIKVNWWMPVQVSRSALDSLGGTISCKAISMYVACNPDVTAKNTHANKAAFKGLLTRLPADIEEAIVDIMELLLSSNPPFPVFKDDVFDRVQQAIKLHPVLRDQLWWSRTIAPPSSGIMGGCASGSTDCEAAGNRSSSWIKLDGLQQ
jgi:hypothetical protein